MLCNDLGREDRGDRTGSVYRGLPAFVPVCASNGAQLLQSAQKSPNRVERHRAETREVTQYEELTRMIQIPSLAPYFYWGFAGSEVFASVLHQQKTPRPLILLPRTGRFPRRFFVHFPRCVRQVFTPKIPALSRRTFTKKP